MLRIFGFVFVFYVIALAAVDSVSFHGQYTKVVLREAGYRASQVQTEMRNFLDRIL